MNAFFVRTDLKEYIGERTIDEEFKETTIRESMAPDGKVTFLSDRHEQLQLLRDKMLYDVERDQVRSVEELFLQQE